ncbi:hemophore-related protein [Mycobacterium sp. THU-M104]|uniref:hemophore-related protein n=1 Tax=Mycobacterium sp. THU-M104 TaxID=3410515 RepID=UPI003B9B1801
MVKLSLTKIAAAAGGVALVFAAGSGVASAEPDLGPIINTTCNYDQVMAAINATSPSAAAQLNAQPFAQNYLRQFLAAAPPQRQAMAAQVQAMPQAAQYFGLVQSVAGTCNNY